MDPLSTRKPRSRRIPRQLWVGLAATLALAIFVEVSRTGLDLLVLLLIGLFIITVERTVGDWLGELLGAGRATLVLATCLGAMAWVLFEKGGAFDHFFAAAEQRGYRTAYYETSVKAPPPAPAPGPVVASTGTGPAPAPASSSFPSLGTKRPRTAPSPPIDIPREADRASSSLSVAEKSLWPLQTSLAVSHLIVRVPTPALTGERIELRARLTSNQTPVPGAAIQFTVNDRAFATARTGTDGTATVLFSARVPGRYNIRASFQNDGKLTPSTAAATLVVLQGSAH